MVVGVCKIVFHLPENHSLKGKRQSVRPIIERIRNRFDVAVAEVDSQDLWQLATIGVACVTDDSQVAQRVLSQVVDFVERSHFPVQLADYEIETFHTL